MRVFNSLQIVALYAAGPSIIGWLFTDPFIYANIIKWISIIAYIIMTWAMVVCVYVGTEQLEKHL